MGKTVAEEFGGGQLDVFDMGEILSAETAEPFEVASGDFLDFIPIGMTFEGGADVAFDESEGGAMGKVRREIDDTGESEVGEMVADGGEIFLEFVNDSGDSGDGGRIWLVAMGGNPVRDVGNARGSVIINTEIDEGGVAGVGIAVAEFGRLLLNESGDGGDEVFSEIVGEVEVGAELEIAHYPISGLRTFVEIGVLMPEVAADFGADGEGDEQFDKGGNEDVVVVAVVEIFEIVNKLAGELMEELRAVVEGPVESFGGLAVVV